MPLLSRESPCIGFCSTVYGDDVCRGCNRYFEEVIHWERLSSEDKDKAIERIHAVLRQAVSEYVTVVNQDMLNAQLAKHQVPLPEVDSAEARVLALFYFGSHFMSNISAYGLLPTKKADGLNAQEIKLAIVQRRVALASPDYPTWKNPPPLIERAS